MRRTLLFFLCSLAITSCVTAASTKRRATVPAAPAINAQPGPKAVSFKSWDLRLQAADFPRGPQHLVQMNVWYPALPGSGTAMTFRDYVIPQFTETNYADPTDEDKARVVGDYRNSLIASGVPPATADQRINAPVNARMSGYPIPNKLYPIIGIVVDANQSLPDHALLGEYLASFGFIVVTTPSITRFDRSSSRTAIDEEQQDDLDRVVSQIGYWPSTLDTPVSIIAFGTGADAALLYAMHFRQPTNALVLVDPKFSPDVKTSTMFDASYKLPPILMLYRQTADLAFVQSLTTAGVTAQPLDEMNAAAESIRIFIDRIWAPTRPPI